MQVVLDMPDIAVGLAGGVVLGTLHMALLRRQLGRMRNLRNLAAGATLRLAIVGGALVVLALLAGHPAQALGAALAGMIAVRAALMRHLSQRSG